MSPFPHVCIYINIAFFLRICVTVHFTLVHMASFLFCTRVADFSAIFSNFTAATKVTLRFTLGLHVGHYVLHELNVHVHVLTYVPVSRP